MRRGGLSAPLVLVKLLYYLEQERIDSGSLSLLFWWGPEEMPAKQNASKTKCRLNTVPVGVFRRPKTFSYSR